MIRTTCCVASILISIAAIILSCKANKINKEINEELDRQTMAKKKRLEEMFGIKLEGGK